MCTEDRDPSQLCRFDVQRRDLHPGHRAGRGFDESTRARFNHDVSVSELCCTPLKIKINVRYMLCSPVTPCHLAERDRTKPTWHRPLYDRPTYADAESESLQQVGVARARDDLGKMNIVRQIQQLVAPKPAQLSDFQKRKLLHEFNTFYGMFYVNWLFCLISWSWERDVSDGDECRWEGRPRLIRGLEECRKLRW